MASTSKGCAFGADGVYACGRSAPAFPSDGPYAPPAPPGAFKCAGGGPPPEAAWTKARAQGAGGEERFAQDGAPAVPAPSPAGGPLPYMPLGEFGAPIA